ncbi:MAG: hypothetical protein ACFFAE_17275 [Candidatus Hodarchaeota archaeon]
MTITLENEVAEDLIKFKLQHIQETISSILIKWSEDNIDDFIKKAKTGELADAEMDAITLKQLAKDIEKLTILLKSVRKEES